MVGTPFIKYFKKTLQKFLQKFSSLNFINFFFIFSAKNGIFMLISEWNIFFEFLLFSWSKFFLTVVNEYAKNQRNSGHSVVSSISATYGKVAAKFSKNSLSLLNMHWKTNNFMRISHHKDCCKKMRMTGFRTFRYSVY